MRIAVFSDTHGNTEKMRDIVRTVNPNIIIHLGDHDKDTKILKQEFPNIPVYSVCGNCDYGSQEPSEGILSVGKVNIFATHGHFYNVRDELDSLVYTAKRRNCQIALYGHTHIPDCRVIDGVTAVNPGTAGIGWELTWALITLSDDGSFSVEICRI